MEYETTKPAFVIAGHEIPPMDGISAAFGADESAYPPKDKMPDDYRRMAAPGCKIASALFFHGGRLSDHGRTPKPGVDSNALNLTLRAMLCSFQPKHEVKIAACGLLIDTYTA